MVLLGSSGRLTAQATIHIQADQTTAKVNPRLYGLMTEEINYSYEGGLYAELIRNRTFKEDATQPVHWSLVQDHGGSGAMALDPSTPLNEAIGTSLKLTVSAGRVGVANEGYWGIPVKPNTQYHASFYAKAEKGFTGPLTLEIATNDGGAVQAHAAVSKLSETWQKYDVKLATGNVKASASNRLVISANQAGTFWLGFVSLFPPTYKNRINGNRSDIMELLADMKPGFLRFPGGNYLEGNTIATRFDWKKTVGDVAHRPGHLDDGWKYWSSDGMGLLEFLNWCEDLHMHPVLAVYAGYSMHQERVKPGPDLVPYVQDALDEIEYVTGGKDTKWGALRAKDGHPAPFPLEYVEIGNEDTFDREAGSYDGRFTQFFDGIKAKYPALNVIATTNVKTRVPDVIDEHYYRRSEDEMASHSHDYDERPRTGPKVFVGEWATRVGEPTPNMSAALGDAAWMTGMERNSDLVIMECYAPLFVNVNPGAMQWKTDLIGYDAMSSYGSPAYWAQQMFSTHHGDQVVKQEIAGVPTRVWMPPARAGKAGEPTPVAPAARQVPLLFFNATRDSKSGTIYLKVVNRDSKPEKVSVSIGGASIEPAGQIVTMAASDPSETNSITEPRKVIPVSAKADGLGGKFTRDFPAYSISVLELKGK